MSYVWLARKNNRLFEANDHQIAQASHSIRHQIAQAQIYLRKAEQIQPNHPFVIAQTANLKADEAIYLWQQGLPYQDTLNEALAIINQALIKHPNNAILLDNQQWLNLNNKQLKQLTQKPSRSIKTTSTTKLHQAHSANELLTLLIDHHPSQIAPQIITTLPKTNDAMLATALWYSKSGQFTLAQQYFAAFKPYFPAIAWLYQRQHLQRFLTSSQNPKLHQQLLAINQLIHKHYPAL